jgi:hypothetical protein
VPIKMALRSKMSPPFRRKGYHAAVRSL